MLCATSPYCAGAFATPWPNSAISPIKRQSALNEFGGALDTLFGPDDVAVRREIRQHEPARRIGAISCDDVVGIDVFRFDFDIFSMQPISTWSDPSLRARPAVSGLVSNDFGRRQPGAIGRDRSRGPPCPG